jgi:putrescine importer
MAMTSVDGARTTDQNGREGLRKDAIGLKGAMMLGVVIMAPSLAILLNWGFMVPSVGSATAVVFAIALVMSLPTAYSYALINSRMPSAGATYKWASRLIGPRVGIAMGLCTTLFYALFIPAMYPFIALQISDLTGSTSTVLFALAMVGAFLLTIPFVYRGVTFTLDAAIILVTIEVIILVVVAVGAFIASGDSKASLAPLNPSDLPSLSLLIPALVLGLGAFTGYDAISTVAEETKTARRLIPKATILAVIAVGVFWVIISTILSDAIPPAVYNKAIEAGGLPLGAAANVAFGSAGRIVIDIMSLEACFGLLLAVVIGSTRLLYAMGRDGVISPRFGTLHPKFQVPWFSVSLALAFAVVVGVLLAIYVGVSFDITLWLVNAIIFFALITYLVINICNPLLFIRHFRSEFHWFSNGVVPAAGILVAGWLMYEGYFKVLWNADFKLGKSVVVASVILLAATGVIAWAIGQRPEARVAARAELNGNTGDMEETETPAPADHVPA